MPGSNYTRVSTGGAPTDEGRPFRAALYIEKRMGHKVSEEQIILLFGTQMLMGRDPSCDIVVDDDRISRKHALIKIEHEAVRLADLGSTNGTTRNNEPLTEEIILLSGDKLCLGQGKTFDARIVEREAAVTSVRLASGADAFLLTPQEFIIGAADPPSDDVDLMIYDPAILQRHARIEFFAGQTFIVSLDQSRPVVVNTKPVREMEIRNNYFIEIGDTLLRYERID